MSQMRLTFPGFLFMALVLGVPIMPLRAEPIFSREQDLKSQVVEAQLKLKLVEQDGAFLEASLKDAKKQLTEKTLALRKLEVANVQHKSLYYQDTQNAPVTNSGIFYDQTKQEQAAALRQLSELKEKREAWHEQWENQKRVLREKQTRLENYQQAQSEKWEYNPF